MARFTTARDRKQGAAAIIVNRRRSSGLALTVRQHYRRPACASGRLYSPGGCGCALLMAPVMAAAMGLAALSLGLAVLALVCLAIAIALTVNEVRRSMVGVLIAAVSWWRLPCFTLQVSHISLFSRGFGLLIEPGVTS